MERSGACAYGLRAANPARTERTATLCVIVLLGLGGMHIPAIIKRFRNAAYRIALLLPQSQRAECAKCGAYSLLERRFASAPNASYVCFQKLHFPNTEEIGRAHV